MRSELLALSLLSCTALAAPLVGPSVGNPDVFVSEGNRLYNAKSYEAAADSFLKATRAAPGSLAAYLGLARAQLAATQTARACYAYRAYLKAAPESAADREKAQAELELCERQKAAAVSATPEPAATFVDKKAEFFAQLQNKRLLGPDSAGEALGALVSLGFLGVDLGDMAQKLHAEAEGQAEERYQRALARQPISTDELRDVRALFQLAADTGTTPELSVSHSAFCEGLAEFQSGDPHRAETLFGEAIAKEPGVTEFRFLRAMAVYKGGDAAGALRALETDLPEDPRTQVLRVALALGQSPAAGAAEVEKLLFQRKFAAGK